MPASASSTARKTAPACSARRRSRSSTASCSLPEGTRYQVLAPVVRGRKGEYDTLLEDLSGQGYVRARIDGEVVVIDEFLKREERLARYEQHKIEIIVDRLVQREGIDRRLTDSLETALRLAEGVAEIEIIRERRQPGRERDDDVLAAPLVPDVRSQLRRARAAQLLVQLAVRRVPDVRRPRHHVRDRPRARHPRPRPVDQRRRDRAVAGRPHPVLLADARRGRPGQRHRPRRAVVEAHGEAAEGPAARRLGQGHRQVPEPLRTHPAVLHRVRGRDPVDQAAPRGLRERVVARAVRGLHARGAVPRVRRAPGSSRRRSRSPSTARTSPRSATSRSSTAPSSSPASSCPSATA